MATLRMVTRLLLIPVQYRELLKASPSFYIPQRTPDMNTIEKCWCRIKQALHRRNRQPTNEAEMQAAMTELYEEIPQEWINELIDKQSY
jgi:hypothetical protein